MPFDATPRAQPNRPQIDRDAVALRLQTELGRPLSWSEYTKIWNTVTEEMGRSDFLE